MLSFWQMFKAGLHVCSAYRRCPVWAIPEAFETPIFGRHQTNACIPLGQSSGALSAPALFVEPRLQYLLPLVRLPLAPIPPPSCDQPAPIALPGLMRLLPYSNTSNCHWATTTFSSRNRSSVLLAFQPVNKQGVQRKSAMHGVSSRVIKSPISSWQAGCRVLAPRKRRWITSATLPSGGESPASHGSPASK